MFRKENRDQVPTVFVNTTLLVGIVCGIVCLSSLTLRMRCEVDPAHFCTLPCWLLGELQARERQGNVVGRKPTWKQTQSCFFISRRMFFFFSLIKNIFIFFCRVKNLGCSRCGWIKPVISEGLLFNQAATSCQFFLFFPSSFPSPLVAELLVIPHQTLFVIWKKKRNRNGQEKRGEDEREPMEKQKKKTQQP